MPSKRSKAWHRRKQVEAVTQRLIDSNEPDSFIGMDLSAHVKDIQFGGPATPFADESGFPMRLRDGSFKITGSWA